MGVPTGYIFILISRGSLSGRLRFDGAIRQWEVQVQECIYFFSFFNTRQSLSQWLAGHFPVTLLDEENGGESIKANVNL